MFGVLYKVNRLRKYIKKIFFSDTYPLLKNVDEIFPIVFNIKQGTWEPQFFPEIYQVCRKSTLECYHHPQNVLCLKNAKVSSKSDIIVTLKGVIWDKAYLANFSKVIPLDADLGKYNKESVTVFRKSKSVYIEAPCMSLLGVHEDIWAHFILQFFGKLCYAAELGILNKHITVLAPIYKDKQLKQIIDDILVNFPNVTLKAVQKNVEYICNEYYYFPSAGYFPNHENYTITIDSVLPQSYLKLLKKYYVDPRCPKLKNRTNEEYKLYLVRRDTFRCMINYQEVENFFISEGFLLVEPHKLLLEEKVRLFYNAKVIVGPYSSAFTNLELCNTNVRVLVFTNLTRATESCYATLLSVCGSKYIMNVTGDDENSNIHTSFYIPVLRIKQAYNQLMHEQ